MMDGMINVNKPVGMTSFKVVSIIRRLTSTKKVGHAGTLDPDAGGVLPICVGRATKVIEFLMEKDKSYTVGLLLGKSTDTQDASGNTLYERPVKASDEEIKKCILRFTGKTEQIPPMYSAISINGRRLYDLARQGIEVERKPRPVTFYDIKIISIIRQADQAFVMLDVSCSKGTYMRTLCHDVGERLGCGGHMVSLVRTASGPFLLENSVTLKSLENLKSGHQLETAFIPMDQAVRHFPAIYVSVTEAKRLRNGLEIPLNRHETGFYRVYLQDGSFLAIGKSQEAGSILKTHKWIGNMDQVL